MATKKQLLESIAKEVKRYDYQERYRVGHYKGYTTETIGGHRVGAFMYQRGGSDELLNIDSGKSKKELQEQLNQLQYVTKKGEQKMIQLEEGYYSLAQIEKADEIITARNIEAYSLAQGIENIDLKYTYKDSQGKWQEATRKSDEPIPPELQDVLNMVEGRTYNIKGYGVVGQKDLRETNPDVFTWLKDQKKYIIKSDKNFRNFRREFASQSGLTIHDKNRILHQNIISALYGKNGRLFNVKVKGRSKLEKELDSLSDSDMLYLFVTRQDVFDFSFAYSDQDVKNHVQKVLTAIEDFKKMKSESIEEYSKMEVYEDAPAYVSFMSTIDSEGLSQLLDDYEKSQGK